MKGMLGMTGKASLGWLQGCFTKLLILKTLLGNSMAYSNLRNPRFGDI